MKKPNLFIVGAPKCGTTSLAYWLSQHPKVYVTDPKEPNYFSYDLVKPNQMERADYEKLFDEIADEEIIAEASTRYLYSSVAVKKALEYSPSAKFIALVRNPIEMFYSLHNHLFQVGTESEQSPEQAWMRQSQRRDNESYRKNNPDADSVMYGEICSLGKQVDRFFCIVPANQRRVILLDDMARNPEKVYSDILHFLSIEEIKLKYEIKNTRFQARSRVLKKLTRTLSVMKQKSGFKTQFGILNALSRMNRKPLNHHHEPNEFDAYLRQFFYQDVDKLSGLLDKDLMHWVQPVNDDSR